MAVDNHVDCQHVSILNIHIMVQHFKWVNMCLKREIFYPLVICFLNLIT